jgi:hypothetical protein
MRASVVKFDVILPPLYSNVVKLLSLIESTLKLVDDRRSVTNVEESCLACVKRLDETSKILRLFKLNGVFCYVVGKQVRKLEEKYASSKD